MPFRINTSFCIGANAAQSVVRDIFQPIPVAASVSDADYMWLNSRVRETSNLFYIYKNPDSAFNHGFPSGLFGVTSKIALVSGCMDDPSSRTGCADDLAALDCDRGTVFQIFLAPLNYGEYAGVNFEEPENWGVAQTGKGYDLTGAAQLVFEARSPDGISVRFVAGETATRFTAIPSEWSTVSIPLAGDLSDVHKLFSVMTNDLHTPFGGTLLLDNIRFDPFQKISGESKFVG